MEDALERRAARRIGERVGGKLRVEALLGVGGMAAVYRVRHDNGVTLALKVLHDDHARDPKIAGRFVREGRASNAVRHPGIVRVLDELETDDGAPCLLMDLLEGESVEEILSARGTLGAADAIWVGSHALAALGAAHAAGVIHRDVKPANLFVTRAGGLFVLDFGVARLRAGGGGDGTETLTGEVFGTPAYMAPEQAAGRTTEIDDRTDVWAVGATLFALLTGEPVHGDLPPALAVARAATRPAPSVTSRAASVPDALAAVVDRALSLDRAARFGSAAEMREALDHACRAALGVSASELVGPSGRVRSSDPRASSPSFAEAPTVAPADVSPRARRGAGRGRRFVAACLAGISLGVVVTSVFALGRMSARAHATAPSSRPSAVVPPRAPPTESLSALRDAPAPAPSHDPSSRAADATLEPKVKRETPSQRPASAPKTPRPRPARGEVGYLSIASYPAATVTVEGYGQVCKLTPCSDIELPAGVHSLALYNEQTGYAAHQRVTITSGEHRQLRFSFD